MEPLWRISFVIVLSRWDMGREWEGIGGFDGFRQFHGYPDLRISRVQPILFTKLLLLDSMMFYGPS